MTNGPKPTVAVLTDLWPSASEPFSGSFVRAQTRALGGDFRHVVLVPRLLVPLAHARVWGRAVQGWQAGWEEPDRPDRLLRYPMLRLPKGGEAEARALGARRALVRAGERPELVHGHFLYEVGVAAVRLARALDVPSVVTVHGTDGRWLVDGGVQERFRRRMLEAARAVDRLVVVERALAEQLVESGVDAGRVEVVPMGVDEQTFRPRPRARARQALGIRLDERIVVFVGRATPEKGVAVLEQALERVGRSVRGVVVGPGSGLDRLEVVGPVSPERVALWLAAADVFCLPSFAEGMPVSVVEALACGRPVVASAVGGIPQQVQPERNGFLVPPGDAGALADALVEALAREWPEEELRATSEPFWWTSVAPRLRTLYEGLLGR